jgi:hypothetical protein
MNPGSSSLPVLVEIHDGRYTQGSIHLLDQTQLCDVQMGRLCGFKFNIDGEYLDFSHGVDIFDDGELSTGLEWTQRLIAAFDRHPSRARLLGVPLGGGITPLR